MMPMTEVLVQRVGRTGSNAPVTNPYVTGERAITTATARLDTTRLRVLCGCRDCGTELVRITVLPGTILSTFRIGKEGFRSMRHVPDVRCVMLGPGWHQQRARRSTAREPIA